MVVVFLNKTDFLLCFCACVFLVRWCVDALVLLCFSASTTMSRWWGLDADGLSWRKFGGSNPGKTVTFFFFVLSALRRGKCERGISASFR